MPKAQSSEPTFPLRAAGCASRFQGFLASFICCPSTQRFWHESLQGELWHSSIFAFELDLVPTAVPSLYLHPLY